MLTGCFVERPSDPHVRLRQDLLRRARWYPMDEASAFSACADDLPAAVACLQTTLERSGAALMQFDRLLSNAEFIILASGLGTPLEQPNPRTRPWVDERVILNLRAEQEETDDLEWGLLFAENFVMLHTELALKPIAGQPRYILLLCVEPPRPDEGGQTVVVPMAHVRRYLDDRQATILRRTRYARHPDAPAFLCERAGRETFSFRDTGGEDVVWRYDGEPGDIDAEEVDAALRQLLSALYRAEAIRGFRWQRGSLAVIDNMRVFHGRTFGGRAGDGPPRHLRRIRVLAENGRPAATTCTGGHLE